MTTQLATSSLDPDQLSILDLIANPRGTLASIHAADFRAACFEVADEFGWVDPNDVSALLHRRFGDINPRAYSAAWAGACGSKNGFMTTHRDVLVPIDSTHSKGNGGKSVPMRRLRDGVSA